jgi:hypothetical protein
MAAVLIGFVFATKLSVKNHLSDAKISPAAVNSSRLSAGALQCMVRPMSVIRDPDEPKIFFLPNLMTACNLACGFFAAGC